MTTNVIIEKKFRKKFQEAMGPDFSSRIQLVRQGEPLYGLLLELSKQTECPVIINTSFNLAGEPNVEKPVDALRTFVSSGIDKLYFENLVVLKGGRE